MKQFIVFAALLAIVFGHSWMQAPLGGYKQAGVPSENTTSPCGFDSNYLTSESITAGDIVRVSWPLLSHGGETTPVTMTLLDLNRTPVTTLTSVPFNSNGGNLNLRIPFAQAAGSYMLQWKWLNFFTCAQVTLAASNIVVTTVAANDTVVSGTAQPATLDYYNFVGNNQNQNFLVTVRGPTGAKFVEIFTGGNTVGIPTASNFTAKFDTAASADAAFGVCNDGSLQDLFIAVQGSATTAGDAYTVQASSYNSLINVGSKFTSGAHSGNRFFTTQSFQTFSEPRRVVITASQPITTPTFDLKVDTTCKFSSKVLVTGSKIAERVGCAQLGSQQGIKFIQVPAMNSGYVISTENGLCSELSGASFLHVSAALLATLIAVLLL